MTSINTNSTDSTPSAADSSNTAASAANKRYNKKGAGKAAAAPGQEAQDGPGFDMDAEPKVPEHLVFPSDPHAPRGPDRNVIHEALHHTAKLGLPPSAPKHELLRASVQLSHRNAAFNGHAAAFSTSNSLGMSDMTSSDSAEAADAAATSVQAQQRRSVYGSQPVTAAGVQDTLAERIYIQQVGLDDDGEKQAKAASQSKAAASAFRQGT